LRDFENNKVFSAHLARLNSSMKSIWEGHPLIALAVKTLKLIIKNLEINYLSILEC
jgi:hypothetical protein